MSSFPEQYPLQKLLSQLAEHNWNLDATASKLGNTREEFVLRLEKVGFGYLLNAEVRQAALKKVKGKRWYKYIILINLNKLHGLLLGNELRLLEQI